ncbi:MAG TPA: hypothetical protein VEM95_01170 [Thermoplasmata archaeon]|nr:hypothetical protein [Thermoplasmata archaeon]
MTPIDAYMARVSRGLAGMAAGVREDILGELRSHLADAAREGNEAQAVAAAENPEAVAARYKELYGYGSAYRAVFVGLAAVLAVPTLPLLLYAGTGNAIAFSTTLAFLGVLVAYLMAVAVKAGARAGLAAGLAACLSRFASVAVLSVVAGAILPDAAAWASFLAVSAMLIVIGFVPGRAKERWRPKEPTL